MNLPISYGCLKVLPIISMKSRVLRFPPKYCSSYYRAVFSTLYSKHLSQADIDINYGHTELYSLILNKRATIQSTSSRLPIGLVERQGIDSLLYYDYKLYLESLVLLFLLSSFGRQRSHTTIHSPNST